MRLVSLEGVNRDDPVVRCCIKQAGEKLDITDVVIIVDPGRDLGSCRHNFAYAAEAARVVASVGDRCH